MLKRVASFLFLITFLTAAALVLQDSRGGSASHLLGGQRAGAAEIEALQKQLGEGDSWITRFGRQFQRILTLDFGETVKKKAILPLLREGFYHTFILALGAALFSLVFGLVGGSLAHVRPAWQKLFLWINYTILSIPVFVVALTLIWIFSLALGWFYPGGTFHWSWFILPSLALGLKTGVRLSLFTYEFMERELTKPYVRTARAYGVRKVRIYSLFIMKNMLLPLLSFWLLDFGSYLAGAAIVETIFSLPGVGTLLLRSLMQYDINLMIAILICVSAMIFAISLVQEAMDRWYARYYRKS